MNTLIISLITLVIGFCLGKVSGFRKAFKHHQLVINDLVIQQKDIQRQQNDLNRRHEHATKRHEALRQDADAILHQQHRGRFKGKSPRMTPDYVSPVVPSMGSRNKVTHIHKTEKE